MLENGEFKMKNSILFKLYHETEERESLDDQKTGTKTSKDNRKTQENEILE